MEEDEQKDVNLMNDFINKQKSSLQNNFQIEFEDFVSYKQDCSDQDEDDELFEGSFSRYDESEELPASSSDQSLILTHEEQEIVDTCTDPDLKKLLILNRTKNTQLLQLQKKIQGFLHECEEELEEAQSVLKSLSAKSSYQQTYLWKLTAPYFKDKKFFAAPRNEDVVRQRAGNELSVYELAFSRKWTPIEFSRLTNAIKCNYNINRQTVVMAKITALKIKIHNEEGEKESLLDELQSLKEQLENLKTDDKLPPLNSNEHIDWYKVADTFLRNKHTASECKSVWHMLVHPQINKSEWSDNENQRLEAIAKKHRYQNWDTIALELQTNRTGFIACLHYFSKLCGKFKKSKFTESEDNQLLEVVEMYKLGNFIPWGKVVCHFNNRSRHQLYHRYSYFLSQNHVKRGKFSEAEDILLIILVNKFGRNFKKCSEYMPHRSQVQLKSRYNSNLQRPIKKGSFTTEDDKIIYEYAQKNGEKNWSGLTSILNRCNAQIRQRYRIIKSYIQENPDGRIDDVPKRRYTVDEGSGRQHNFLSYIAAQYKDAECIPTLAVIEECLQSELASQSSGGANEPESNDKIRNIDTILTDFFRNSVISKPRRMITEKNLKDATDNAHELLKLLRVKLDIPSNLEPNSNLDNIDVEILEALSKKSVPQESEITDLTPPNLSTLVGLKSLILKHKEFKGQQKDFFTSNFVPSSEASQHRELFSKRFDALFTWSAVLSLEKPNEVEEIRPSTSSGDAHKRSASASYPPAKKRKVSMSALTSLAQNPQLQLVDKDVVERLIKKNNLNVIRIETVTGSDGKLKSVLLRNNEGGTSQSTGNGFTVAPNEDTVEVTDSDLQDVQALDNMIKKMKCENDSGESNDEDDLRLLREAIKFEKTFKVEPD